MSLRIRRIALSNFRKYRDSFVLDGLTDGLNVIIEPNETGKSTLLEAMRAEVGTIMGGTAYQRVRPRIDSQYAEYWTNSGRPTGRQTAARDEHDTAQRAASEAATRLAALEQGFSDLEAARARLKVLDRDLADTTDAEQRRALVGQLEVARSAAQLLDTRRASQPPVKLSSTRLRRSARHVNGDPASSGSWLPHRNGRRRPVTCKPVLVTIGETRMQRLTLPALIS